MDMLWYGLLRSEWEAGTASKNMIPHDDDLIRFELQGAAPLPGDLVSGSVTNRGASIWYATCGKGLPVFLLHGGMGNSRNWGYQVPALLAAGYRLVLVDSRGHGRSTRDEQPFSYELMASDVLAVMDALGIGKAALVGWSDGACTALVLADRHPERVAGVFYFACNMDPGGAKEFVFTPLIGRASNATGRIIRQLSPTPEEFESFSAALGVCSARQPNYSAQDLARLAVPVTIVQAENDEFIKREHAEYLARSIPGAEYVFLPGVSHFAPLQRPELFNSALLNFLQEDILSKMSVIKSSDSYFSSLMYT